MRASAKLVRSASSRNSICAALLLPRGISLASAVTTLWSCDVAPRVWAAAPSAMLAVNALIERIIVRVMCGFLVPDDDRDGLQVACHAPLEQEGSRLIFGVQRRARGRGLQRARGTASNAIVSRGSGP